MIFMISIFLLSLVVYQMIIYSLHIKKQDYIKTLFIIIDSLEKKRFSFKKRFSNNFCFIDNLKILYMIYNSYINSLYKS